MLQRLDAQQRHDQGDVPAYPQRRGCPLRVGFRPSDQKPHGSRSHKEVGAGARA
jgi:hypothetical protein